MATKIYLDQGHNPEGVNAGAEGNGYREQDLVYTIGVLTAEILRKNGLEVKLSRPTAETTLGTSNATSLAYRTSEANAWGADYFISLHANAASNPAASWSEAFVYKNTSAAYQLAANILTQLEERTGIPNRGVSARPSLYVLRKTKMPATLVELGFITNSGDAALMAENPELFAEGIAAGVLGFLGIL